MNLDMTEIINQMIILFIMIGIGFICYKVNIMTEDMQKKVTKLLLYVTIPCFVLSSVAKEESFPPRDTVVLTLLLSFIMYLIFPIFGIVINTILRVPKKEYGLYLYMTEFSNIGFMGFPVVAAIFGEKAILLCSISNMLYSIFQYSLGIILMNYGKDGNFKISIKNMINPGLIASVTALAIYFAKFKIPNVLAGTFETVGNVTTPMAMILIGSSLAAMSFKEIFGEVRLYPYAIIKQILLPWLIMFVLGFVIQNKLVLGVFVVIAAMPVGATSVMFANLYDADARLAAKGVFITTICSFFTIPLLCMMI